MKISLRPFLLHYHTLLLFLYKYKIMSINIVEQTHHSQRYEQVNRKYKLCVSLLKNKLITVINTLMRENLAVFRKLTQFVNSEIYENLLPGNLFS